MTSSIKNYDDLLTVRLDDENFQLNSDDGNAFFILDDEDMTDATVVPTEANQHTVDVDDVLPEDNPTEEAYDNLLHAEVVLQEGGEQTMGTVTKRAQGADGRPIGTRAENPMSDTRMYEV
jgi:formylglycine-generating enzyme required for sulfatase activity